MHPLVVLALIYSVPILLVLLLTGTINLGYLAGSVEKCSAECEFEKDLQFYNGLRTYYFLFIPLWSVGFYHSTAWFDD